MLTFKDFDEIKAAVGNEVGVSDWVEVTQERIDRFAEALHAGHILPEDF